MKSVLSQNRRPSKSSNQVTHVCVQCPGDFHKRIHRRRFFSALDAAGKDCRKVGFFSQFFLGQTGMLAFGANGLTQETAVVLADRHDGLNDGKQGQVAMSR